MEDDKYHYGSHYSNPGIVLQYLIRVPPYTEGIIELHGGKLDMADRIFYSIQESLRNAMTDIADIREPIPEFYFLPEMFQNRERVHFGTTQEGVVVDNVVMPQWAQGDSYRYVW